MNFRSFAFLCFFFCSLTFAAAAERPRLLVLTDIGGDPDDQQAMVRLMVYANEFDIEGLIASAAGTPGELKEAVTKPRLIREIVNAYGRVRDNLARHAEGYPSAQQLLGLIKSGNPRRGRDFIGEGHDTEGSRWIIACADKVDARPLNITIWGGQTDLAQALWCVRTDRGEAGLRAFMARLRVFDIADQDGLHDWLFAEFPDLDYILSNAPQGADKRTGAFRGMYLGGDESLTSREWMEANVRTGHGPLGALYPPKTWTKPNPHGAVKEGDTPAWFFFLTNGLGDPDHPEWGGWGGRYTREKAGLFRDARDSVGDVTDARASVWRWRPAFQNEFAARLDWCVRDEFKKANHAPDVVLNGDRSHDVLKIVAKPSAAVELSAAGTSDPDGHPLNARWFIYREASTTPAALSAAAGTTVRLTIPAEVKPGAVHVILAIEDSGVPALTSYRRAIVEVLP